MSEYKWKRRTLTTSWPTENDAYAYSTITGVKTPIGSPASSFHPITTKESTWSRGNPYQRTQSRRSKTSSRAVPQINDVGGNFTNQKYSVQQNDIFHALNAPSAGSTYYSGALYVTTMGMTGRSESNIDLGMSAIPRSDSLLETDGASAIANRNPTSPQASLAQTLIELKREGLPSLRSALFKKGLRGLGDDWLNVQFGWKPLISDLRKAAIALTDVETLLSQYKKDAGKPVRRRTRPVYRDVITPTRTVSTSYLTPAFSTWCFSSAGTLITTVTRQRAIWFSGTFQYYIPSTDNLIGQVQMLSSQARYILGLTLDPATVWELLGWSWLIDWIFNAGDVIANFTSFNVNNEALPYGYIMCHTLELRESVSSGVVLKANPPCGELRFREAFETKQRLQASPYGFGLTWEEFSPYQVGILAALGISKGR